MQGKTVVITGATSGIGEIAAIRLAAMGARIVFVARDRARADATLAKLRQANGGADHVAHIADLSGLAQMRSVAEELARLPRIDVLINNAGALFGARQESVDGLEMTFAVNHMAYFVLTTLLLPHLQPGARIVSTASNAHQGGKLDFNDLQLKKGYRAWVAYGNSKLCNILFTRELARRTPAGITANCLHPGFVDTRFGESSSGFLRALLRLVKPVGAISPEDGAKTIIHLASSPDVANITGAYFYKCRPATPSRRAQNDADARKLWAVSEEIAGRSA